jgi:hypothetical protein
MGDPCRDGVTEILRCDSSSLALSLEEPEATLIDCAKQVAVSLNLIATILGRYLVGGVYPDLGIRKAVMILLQYHPYKLFFYGMQIIDLFYFVHNFS